MTKQRQINVSVHCSICTKKLINIVQAAKNVNFVFELDTHRVTQQCCPGANCLEIPRRPPVGCLEAFFVVVSRRFPHEDPPQCTKKFYRGSPGGLQEVSGGFPDNFRQDNIAEQRGILFLVKIG